MQTFTIPLAANSLKIILSSQACCVRPDLGATLRPVNRFFTTRVSGEAIHVDGFDLANVAGVHQMSCTPSSDESESDEFFAHFLERVDDGF